MSDAYSTIHRSGFHYDEELGVCFRTLDFMGFPGYRVGDDGSVWSLWGRGALSIGKIWKILKTCKSWTGHLFVSLKKGNDNRKYSVHSLVLSAFGGIRPNGLECCHNDGNSTNNVPENLRWDTHENNIRDSIKHGTHSPPPLRDENFHNVLLSVENVKSIRRDFREKFGSYCVKKAHERVYAQHYADEAEKYQVPNKVIRRVISGFSWKSVTEN